MFSTKSYKTILYAVIPSFAFYVIILALASSSDIPPELVLRDPGQIYGTEKLPEISLGLISNIGILLWAASTSICLFSLLFGLTKYSKYRKILSLGFFLSLTLCLDDFFLIHDRHQLNQDILYLTYPILAVILILKLRNQSRQYSVNALLISFLFLGLSVFTDIFQDFFPLRYESMQIIEEGFKFIGIFTWLYFWSYFSSFAIIKNFKENVSEFYL